MLDLMGHKLLERNEVFGFKTQIIGIYVTWREDFNISVSDTQLMGCFTDEINNVERLPFQCKNDLCCQSC